MKIHRYPDPCLLREAESCDCVDAELRKLAADMLQTMYESKGVGLAATQVGVPRRLIVVNLGAAPGKGEEIALVNPETVEASRERVEDEEGCLSLPGITRAVSRPGTVVVRGLGLDGKGREIEAQGMLARVLQHEIDHLDGILFISKLTPADLAAIKPKLRELRDKARESEC